MSCSSRSDLSRVLRSRSGETSALRRGAAVWALALFSVAASLDEACEWRRRCVGLSACGGDDVDAGAPCGAWCVFATATVFFLSISSLCNAPLNNLSERLAGRGSGLVAGIVLLLAVGVLGVGWCNVMGEFTKQVYVGEVGADAVLLVLLLLLTKGCSRRWRRGLARGRGVGVVVLLRGGVRGEHEVYR